MMNICKAIPYVLFFSAESAIIYFCQNDEEIYRAGYYNLLLVLCLLLKIEYDVRKIFNHRLFASASDLQLIMDAEEKQTFNLENGRTFVQ